ncbi:MAG: hypothetical protein CMI54_05400 [Parcubacteria group bacterium]|nr:hypothetical protein [Parcubacteria group bacterium]|tara:strand:- start:10557 stop:10844 length:288 start_codon:yes stop_codon:yes gene_type:complete
MIESDEYSLKELKEIQEKIDSLQRRILRERYVIVDTSETSVFLQEQLERVLDRTVEVFLTNNILSSLKLLRLLLTRVPLEKETLDDKNRVIEYTI